MSSEEWGARIVDIDYVLCKPIDNLDICLSSYSGNQLSLIPVIRIFGILNNKNNDKCCIHIHRVFPYLLVPFYPKNKNLINTMNQQQINIYLTSFGKQIENIINSLNNENNNNNNNNQNNRNHKKKELFYNLSIVYAKDFYGYHYKQEAFIKISLIDPKDIKRVVMILLSGVINECIYQPFESHIPYLLHFFIDYNLYGMNFMYFKSPLFRQPIPSQNKIAIHLLSSKQIKRESTCKYEIDLIAENILNTKWINKIDINDADIDKHKLVPSVNDIWNWEKNRRKEIGLTISTNLSSLFSPPPKRIIKDIPQTRIEKRYKNILKTIIEKYKEENPNYHRDEIQSPQHMINYKTYADDITATSIKVEIAFYLCWYCYD